MIKRILSAIKLRGLPLAAAAALALCLSCWEGYNDFYGDWSEDAPAPGTLGEWKTAGSMPTPNYAGLSVAYNNHLYIFGGYSTMFGSPNYSYRYAPINADGTLGDWSADLAVPGTELFLYGIAAYGGYIYIVGGAAIISGSSSVYNTCYYAKINADGSLGTWTTTSTLVTAVGSVVCTVYKDYIYAATGTSGGISLQYAKINADGTVGSWTEEIITSMSNRSQFSFQAYSGYLYIGGGVADSSAYNDVQFAPVNSDGSWGAWKSTNPFSAEGNRSRCVFFNGYIYLIDSSNAVSVDSTTVLTAFKDVQYSKINTDGTIGSWQGTTKLPAERYNHSVAFYNGYVYLTGGVTSGVINSTAHTWTGTVYSDVIFAKIH